MYSICGTVFIQTKKTKIDLLLHPQINFSISLTFHVQVTFAKEFVSNLQELRAIYLKSA
jgi:hypothetical protein